MKTTLGASKDKILINGKPVYAEIAGVNPASLGLLWNQRMIQGVFDDKTDRTRFNLFGRTFDADANTDNLIAALPAWHAYGLRAITVGFQGGWPVNCVDVRTIDNNPFGEDGLRLDPQYAARMDRVIRAADALGMVVIVCVLYWAQSLRLRDGRAVAGAVKTAAAFLRENRYTNVIIEVANEYNIAPFAGHPLVHQPEGMACLIDMAREHSGGMPVGSSGGGGMADPEVVAASDIVLVHGNGLSRGEYDDFIRKVRQWAPDKPIVCNEDSPCVTRVDVALETGTSWGYYNNYTKQIPPADHGVTPGEDLFFARRMARAVGIPVPALPRQDQFVLQGLEPETSFHGMRAIRLAAERPEAVDHVTFSCNGKPLYTAWDEPFFCWRESTWLAHSWTVDDAMRNWKAEIHLVDGTVLEREVVL
jgi:hypothetical protein